ncbi:TRAP transporter substrate-binding protein DctP [Stappia sp. ES.058]|uniref:TRAP transporter substrate-binding protein DctP n=1 Tax=Stappia sp. ES.058 TaxID=1881061 RepID=UPI00087ABE4E|nr:TRAP transporter substrate-binding protein DctP [Stappia sp. ES.058]SDU03496.1 TRAP-type C4-dicarboxylate transport system, substrate-binding protein [Stappia sp. ES.058]
MIDAARMSCPPKDKAGCHRSAGEGGGGDMLRGSAPRTSVGSRFRGAPLVGLLVALLGFASAVQAADYTMTIAHLYPDDLTNNETAPALKHFEQLVETATDGAVQVEVFGNGALGGEVEAAQQARGGKTIQSVMLGSGTQASFYRNYEMITAPFLFPDYRTAWAFFDSAWFAEFMKPMVAESGLRYLGTLDDGGGFVAFANNKRLIRTVEDLKGMRIRVEENQAHMTIMRALGASPTPLPWGELQTGLATGLVDGHFHAPGVNDIFKLYDVTDYTTWSGHVYNTITWSVSEAWFKELPRDYQKIIVSSAREAVAMAHGIATQITVVGWVNSCEKFDECYVLPDAEKKRMRDIAQPIYRDWLVEEFGPKAKLFDDMRAQIDRIQLRQQQADVERYLD